MMETLRRVAPRHGLAGPAAREAVRRHQRVGQAQQLVDGHRHRRQPARPAGRHPHATCSSWCSCCAVIRAVDIHADLLARVDRLGRERSPARRQRGAAGDHLDLPGRHAHRTSSSRSRRACPSGPCRAASSTSARARCPRCRAIPATGTGPRPSPSPGTSSSSAPWGRSASIAWPNTVLNTIVAESLDYMATELEKAGGPEPARRPSSRRHALSLLQKILKQHKRVIFRGRQLLDRLAQGSGPPRPADHAGLGGCLPDPVRARRTSTCSGSTGCSPRSSWTRGLHIAVEKFVKQLVIEAETMIVMARTQILPAATQAPDHPGRRDGRDRGRGRQDARCQGVAGRVPRRHGAVPEGAQPRWRRRRCIMTTIR